MRFAFINVAVRRSNCIFQFPRVFAHGRVTFADRNHISPRVQLSRIPLYRAPKQRRRIAGGH